MPAGVTSGIRVDSSFMNLKSIGNNQVRPEVNELLLIFFVSGLTLQFDFRAGVDIRSISHFIASHVL